MILRVNSGRIFIPFINFVCDVLSTFFFSILSGFSSENLFIKLTPAFGKSSSVSTFHFNGSSTRECFFQTLYSLVKKNNFSGYRVFKGEQWHQKMLAYLIMLKSCTLKRQVVILLNVFAIN